MIEIEGRRKVWATLEEVLAKATWEEDDITVLVAHKDHLDEATLVKLGVIEAPVDEAPVVKAKKVK